MYFPGRELGGVYKTYVIISICSLARVGWLIRHWKI